MKRSDGSAAVNGEAEPNAAAQAAGRLNYRATFLLGWGFLAISLAWSVFNSYVPIFLKGFITSTALVGSVMALDNLAGLTLQPYFSALSDRIRTRFGRRMPFLIAGVPPAALFFLFLPLATTAPVLLLIIVIVDLAMSVFRGPTVALMPDLTPAPLRSKANGVINFMGGLGALVALFLGSQLYRIHPFLPFALAAAVMLLAMALLLRYVREPVQEPVPATGLASAPAGAPAGGSTPAAAAGGIIRTLLGVVRAPDKSGIRLLAAIFCWFIAWNGAETFFTTYGKYELGLPESTASFALGFFSLTFLLCAIPSGLLASRIGRRRTISLGLAGMVLVMLALTAVRHLPGIEIILLVGGVCWACININSYPMVAELAGGGSIGAFTGLYYFFSSLAAVLAPPFFGYTMDRLGYSSLFPLGSVFLLAALFLISGVRRGEAEQG